MQYKYVHGYSYTPVSYKKGSWELRNILVTLNISEFVYICFWTRSWVHFEEVGHGTIHLKFNLAFTNSEWLGTYSSLLIRSWRVGFSVETKLQGNNGARHPNIFDTLSLHYPSPFNFQIMTHSMTRSWKGHFNSSTIRSQISYRTQKSQLTKHS